MVWLINPETAEHFERHESPQGYVLKTPDGWDAFLYLGHDHLQVEKIGECYPSAHSARMAVRRAFDKYSPTGKRA